MGNGIRGDWKKGEAVKFERGEKKRRNIVNWFVLYIAACVLCVFHERNRFGTYVLFRTNVPTRAARFVKSGRPSSQKTPLTNFMAL